MCGTPAYLAPEVLDGSPQGYSAKVDSWSMGVIVYAMYVFWMPQSLLGHLLLTITSFSGLRVATLSLKARKKIGMNAFGTESSIRRG